MSVPTAQDEPAGPDGFGCGQCLDFGDLPGLGPCPYCNPDGFAEYLAMVAATAAHWGMP